MPSLLGLAWLIPLSPLLGATFIGLLLISFNRTMNRLTKPVSFLLISSSIFSTIFSVTLLVRHLYGKVISLHLNAVSLDFQLDLFNNYVTSIACSIVGTIFSIVMIYSYYSLQRKQGYVRYIVLVSLALSLVFLLILSGDPSHNFLTSAFTSFA